MNEKGRKKLNFWCIPFDVTHNLVLLGASGLNIVELNVFAHILNQYAANNAYSKSKLSVPVSQAELRKIADTKSKSQIEKAIKHLQSMSLIECTDKGNGRKAAKYKVIDERFLPDKLRKKPP